MYRFFNVMLGLSRDKSFVDFQNQIIQSAYESIGRSYANNDNEVAIVTNLVETLNGKKFKNIITLSADKIHGARSYVSFNCRDKPVTKELGDMAIISLVTAGNTRLLQRICIIQNKKSSNKKWEIDREQLFLLKNFPPFTGERGIFRILRKNHKYIFYNRSGCLGAFGLLFEPGEMIFISAPLMEGFLQGNNTLPASEIGFPPSSQHSFTSTRPFNYFGYPILYYSSRISHTFYDLYKSGIFAYELLGNFLFGYDLHDFIRAWTQINLGELTLVDGKIIDEDVDAFANHLIRSAHLDQGIDFPIDERQNEKIKTDGNMAVFLFHIDVGRSEEEIS